MSISKIRIGNVEHELETTISNVSGLQDALNAKAEVSDIPTKVSELTNDKNYLTAIPSEYVTETELASKGYLTEHQSLADYTKTDDLGNLAFKDNLTASDVGADASGTASSAVSAHNANTSAHSDIRSAINTVNTYIGNIPDGYTESSIVSYINKKAEETLNAANGGSSESAASVAAALNTYKAENNSKVEANTASITAVEEKLDNHNHDNNYDAKGAANTALNTAKEYTNTKVSGLASTSTVDTKISSHNTNSSAHNDIRVLIADLTTRLNALANSTDEDLDQMAEIVAYIKNNKSLIDSVTTSKVNVSDIVNNLTTNVSNKPLAAAQGVAIKALIDALQKELDSHSHAMSDVSGLQSALDGKAASSHGTHVSYSTTAPVMDGTASAGSASSVARSDHKHPTDTSRASKTEFDTHAGNTTVHITSSERTNWGTAYTHSQAAHAPSNAEKNQNAFSNITVGSTTVSADSTTDTVTFVGSNVTITPDATNDKITFAVADGTTSAKGVVQLTDSTSSTSTTTAATPNSVKSAYDLANTAKTNAATAQSKADSAYSLAEGKADASHGTHVTYSSTTPVMDGTASVGSASTVARSDHKHPTDTTRAAQADLTSHTGNTTVHITSTERTNWNAAKTATEESVRFTAQTLTDAQKAQVRANIGAAAVGEGGGGEDSGSIQVNYSVVGSPNEPENPTENMIWVQTEEINGYVLSKNEPKNPSDGFVWISLGDSSSVAFHTFKIGEVEVNEVFPLSAKQYISGAWVNVIAKSRQNSEWVDWVKYLYNEGNECESVTGGWSNNNVTVSNGISVNALSVTKKSTYIELTQTAKTQGAAFTTNSSINLTDYSKVIFDGDYSESDSYAWALLSAHPTRDTVRVNCEAEITNNVMNGNIQLDVLGIQGNRYISIILFSTCTLTIRGVWLE